MNQAFKHNFNVQKEETTKRVPDLGGTSEYNGDYNEAGHIRNICFVWLDGKRTFLNYSYLVSGEYSPAESIITLCFTSQTIIIKGINLENLFYELMQQIKRQVVCVDARYNNIQEDNRSVVNEIIVKENESP